MELINRQWMVELKHVFREFNVCADFLAKEGHNHGLNWKVSRKAPIRLESVILSDALGIVYLRQLLFFVVFVFNFFFHQKKKMLTVERNVPNCSPFFFATMGTSIRKSQFPLCKFFLTVVSWLGPKHCVWLEGKEKKRDNYYFFFKSFMFDLIYNFKISFYSIFPLQY